MLILLVVTHLLVVFYEEPHLRRVFGQPYDDYRRHVGRWIPTWRS
jgi:protein-S-isoprenylcysteine O-methyltransferase Ste14